MRAEEDPPLDLRVIKKRQQNKESKQRARGADPLAYKRKRAETERRRPGYTKAREAARQAREPSAGMAATVQPPPAACQSDLRLQRFILRAALGVAGAAEAAAIGEDDVAQLLRAVQAAAVSVAALASSQLLPTVSVGVPLVPGAADPTLPTASARLLPLPLAAAPPPLSTSAAAPVAASPALRPTAAAATHAATAPAGVHSAAMPRATALRRSADAPPCDGSAARAGVAPCTARASRTPAAPRRAEPVMAAVTAAPAVAVAVAPGAESALVAAAAAARAADAAVAARAHAGTVVRRADECGACGEPIAEGCERRRCSSRACARPLHADVSVCMREGALMSSLQVCTNGSGHTPMWYCGPGCLF